MAARELKLQVVLAALDRATGPLKHVMGSSTALGRSIKATSGELKDLRRQQEQLSSFRQLKNDVSGAGVAFKAAQQRVAGLRAEIAAADKPTRQMSNNLRRAEQAAATLQAKFRGKAGELRRVRTELSAAGVAARDFGEHERKLKTRIEQTTSAMQAQQKRLGNLQKSRELSQRMHHGGMVAAMHGAGAAAGGAVALGQARQAMQPGLDFESQLRDMAITGGFDRKAEAQLGLQIRQDALRFAQSTENIGAGLQVLVANGISSAQDLKFYSGLIAKGTVGTGAAGEDLSSTFTAFQQNLRMVKDEMGGALDGLAWQAKQGSFELKNMAAWMPQLAPQMAAFGASGKSAAFELGAALQIARRGAGTNDEAANNLKNYLSKLTSPDTLKDFDKVGIDLKGRLMQLQAQGVSPLMGSLQVIEEYMATKGPQAAEKYRAAMAQKDDAERAAALEQLAGAYALGDLFQDMQAMSFVKVALANKEDLQKFSQGANGASGTVDADWAARMDTGQKQLDRFSIRMNELKLQSAAVLMPALKDLAGAASGLIDRLSRFAQEHPALAGGMLKVAVAGAAVAAVLGGLLLVGGTAAMMFSQMHGAAMLLSGGQGGIGFLMKQLGRLAGGGIMRVIGALRLLSVALFTTPIGWVILGITAIAAGAYLIYRNWDKIGPWFNNLWTGVKQTAANALSSVVITVSTAWDRAMAYLQGRWTAMKSIGSALMDGLVNGLLGGLAKVGETITAIGGKVVGWLKGKLGIHSPSRVFAQLGDYTMQGLAGGLERSQRLPLGQVATLGNRMQQAGAGLAIAAAASPAIAIDNRPPLSAAPPATASSAVYHIAVHVHGASQPQDIALAVRAELERLEREKAARTRSRLGDYGD
jgi:TP901 family phage tail tape measure protein